MYVHYRCQTVPTDALELASCWNIHPCLAEDNPILQSRSSIIKMGLIYMPFVLEQKGDSYSVVTGMRTIAAAIRLHNLEAVQCRVLAADTPMETILSCIYEEYANNTHELSPIEMAHFYALCNSRLASSELEPFLADHNIPGKPHHVRRALDLLELESPLQAGLYEGGLTESSAREMLRLKAEDRIACYALFQQLRLGGGKQRRMLSLLRDLAGRQGCTLADFIASPTVQDILEHLEMNTPQKAHFLLQNLQQLHTPSLAEAEEQFERWKAQLPLAPHCDVEHSASFEQDKVSLRITFENRETLAKTLVAINALL